MFAEVCGDVQSIQMIVLGERVICSAIVPVGGFAAASKSISEKEMDLAKRLVSEKVT